MSDMTPISFDSFEKYLQDASAKTEPVKLDLLLNEMRRVESGLPAEMLVSGFYSQSIAPGAEHTGQIVDVLGKQTNGVFAGIGNSESIKAILDSKLFKGELTRSFREKFPGLPDSILKHYVTGYLAGQEITRVTWACCNACNMGCRLGCKAQHIPFVMMIMSI